MKRTSDDADLDKPAVAEWQPAPGESPAEREKRIKREKRAAVLAAAGAATSSTSAGVDGTGWQPAPGESPAEREKRIKREKRAAKLAAEAGQHAPQAGAGSYGGTSYQQQPYNEPPPTFTTAEPSTAAPTIHPSRLATAPALAAAAAVDDGTAKSRNAQAKTAARLKYLTRKKDRAKARKAAAPKKKGDKGRSMSVVSGSAIGGEDEGEGDEGASDVGSNIAPSGPKTPEQLAEIARKKEERRVKRLEKKAELKKMKEAGISVAAAPPKPNTRPAKIAPRAPKPEKIVPTNSEASMATEPDSTTTIANSEADERMIREAQEAAEAEREKEARKEAKRAKRAARREEIEAAGDQSMAVDADADLNAVALEPIPQPGIEVGKEQVADTEADNATKQEEPATLYRLPSATRPAPPSARVLSSLRVHEAVRHKVVIDPDHKISLTVSDDDDGESSSLGVSERGRKRLALMGVKNAFAVQTATFPLLLPAGSSSSSVQHDLYRPFHPFRDICVSAPTGSGKTLSYVVPIVETLAHRVIPQLRALVLLPTRDLVEQVRDTFELFSRGTGLRIATAAGGGGGTSFASEGSNIVGSEGVAGVDVLIATPGRLMDHLRKTKGFTLGHLRFLVVDEADRLLTQSFHDWLPSVLAALKSNAGGDSDKEIVEVEQHGARALAPEQWDSSVGRVASDVDVRVGSSCQKLLFSATLSRDPAKIDALHLHRPIYISVEDARAPTTATVDADGNEIAAEDQDDDDDGETRFTFPPQLSEHMIVSPSAHKPLYLFHLLLSNGSGGQKNDRALCFTKSVEAATRLAKLVEFFEEERRKSLDAESSATPAIVVKAYSSELPPAERSRILTSFKKGEIQMLICSDLISRGIDLPHVSHVISYDIPSDLRKYVHRVGRTARAGNAGAAWSLVEDQEVAPFKAMMKGGKHWEAIKRVRVKEKEVEGFTDAYQTALERLRLHFATGQAKRDGAEQ